MNVHIFPWPNGTGDTPRLFTDHAILGAYPDYDLPERTVIETVRGSYVVNLPFEQVVADLRGEELRAKGKVTAQTVSYPVVPRE